MQPVLSILSTMVCSVMMAETGIYVHIPFCKHHCGYCDFVTYAGREEQIPAYIQRLQREILRAGEKLDDLTIATIFFGGGTPSFLAADDLKTILTAIKAGFQLTSDCEISLEANPGTIDQSKLEELREAGFNRISIGAQSAMEAELRLMERIHSVEEIEESVRAARATGFENINLDFIYGIPGQTGADWMHSLDYALAAEPEHLSLYGLTIEPGTPFYKKVMSGIMPPVDENLEADFYHAACEILETEGFIHYEISNWARGVSQECRHNLRYWRNDSYLGFGAGAHGYFNGIRYQNSRSITRYLYKMDGLNVESSNPFHMSTLQHKVTQREAMQDHMILGLRLLREGVKKADFEKRFGLSVDTVYGKEITRLVERGLITDDGTRIRLTKKAWLISNQVFIQFIDSLP